MSWKRVWLAKRKRRRGVSYALQWYGEDGRIRSETVSSDKRLAEQMRRQRENEINSGAYKGISRIHWEDFTREYLELAATLNSPGTVEQVKLALRQFGRIIEPRYVCDISVRTVERFIIERSKTVRPATVNKDCRHLRAVFQRAAGLSYIKENVFRRVKFLPESEKDLRILSTGEIRKLLAAAPNLMWRCVIQLSLETGMRRGEVLNLTWVDVNLDELVVEIRSKAGWTTKNKRNRRAVISRNLTEMLVKLRRQAEGIYVYIPPNSGRTATNYTHNFKAIVKRAGISHCTPHDLRRTFCSYLANAHVNQTVLRQMAGHLSHETTAKYYIKILPDTVKEAHEKLPWVNAG